MDSYLEGYLWPDVHSALAHTIRQQLAPQIQPKYVTRLEISIIEDQSPAAEIGIMYPNSAALRTIYDAAFYHLSIDYTQAPPPPPFSQEERAWLRTQLDHSTCTAL
jgi:Protein of unknown function (DUF4058)